MSVWGGKRKPHTVLPPFLGSPESQGPSSPSGKSHWCVECSLEQFCPGKFRVQGQLRCQWSWTRPVVGRGGLACGVGWGCGKHDTTAPREAGRGWGRAQGSRSTCLEVEVRGAPKVSVPGCTGGRMSLGWWWWWGPWHLLAWLFLLCVLCIWPGVTGSLLLITALSSLVSLLFVGLGPRQLGQLVLHSLCWLWDAGSWLVL